MKINIFHYRTELESSWIYNHIDWAQIFQIIRAELQVDTQLRHEIKNLKTKKNNIKT